MGRPWRWWRPVFTTVIPPSTSSCTTNWSPRGRPRFAVRARKSRDAEVVPQRNGVLAALTQATVVVQAPVKSGARSTAKHARRLGRPLFVTPAWPWDLQGEGNLLELRLGRCFLPTKTCSSISSASRASRRPLSLARAQAVERPSPPSTRACKPRRTLRAPPAESAEGLVALVEEPPHLSPSCAAIFRATSATPKHLDDLCFLTGLSAALVQEALLTLTLEAVLVEGPAGCFRRATARKY